MTIPKSSVTGVKVSTWGSSTKGGNGLLHYLDATLFGGNVGHAAVTVTFPADQKGKALIEKYCGSIPHTKKIVSTRKGNKAINKDDDNAFEEEIYEVYFSYWPSTEGGFALSSPLNDNIQEHEGSRFDWADNWAKLIQPETRHHRGQLGNRFIVYGPGKIVHQREMTDNEIEEYRITDKIHLLERRNTSALILANKLLEIKESIEQHKTYVLSDNTINLLNSFLPHWKDLLGSQKLAQLNLDTIEKIQRDIEELKDGLQKQTKALYTELSRIAPNSIHNLNQQITAILEQEEHLKSPLASLNKIMAADTPIVFDEALRDLLRGVTTWLSVRKRRQITIILDHADKTQKIDKDTLKEILRPIQTHASAQLKALEEEKNKILALISIQNQKKVTHVTEGLPPSHTIFLPTTNHALNVEKMLQKMVELTHPDADNFNLITKNCSVTVGAILAAGASDKPQLARFFQNKAFGYYGNPQEVYNNSLKFQAAIIHGGSLTAADQIHHFNPIEQAGGYLIGIIEDSRTSKFKKGLAYIGGFGVGLAAVVPFILTKALNPLASFRGAVGLIGFTFSRNSKALKVAALILLGPATLMLAIPAGIQYGITKIFIDPIKNLFTLSTQEKLKREQEILEKISPKKNQFSSSDELNERISKVFMKTSEIQTVDSLKALKEAHDILNQDNKLIPHFSTQSLKSINQALTSAHHIPINEKNPAQKTMEKLYINVFENIASRLKKLENEANHEHAAAVKKPER